MVVSSNSLIVHLPMCIDYSKHKEKGSSNEVSGSQVPDACVTGEAIFSQWASLKAVGLSMRM